MPGLIRLPAPAGHGLGVARRGDAGPVGCALLGASFALGCTACATPVLAPVLVLAANAGTAAQGLGPLNAFTSGFAVPFLLLALLWDRLAGRWSRYGRDMAALHRAAGWDLVGCGVLLYFGALSRISS